MSGHLWHTTLRELLAGIGITPWGDPGRYDQLQRDAEKWWDAGGSMRSFVAAVRSGESTQWLNASEARRVLERRYLKSP